MFIHVNTYALYSDSICEIWPLFSSLYPILLRTN
uniref:Uncharacterized protein n=1 Tax=Arundo donax TaxID=35708 RepID=A0A0A9A5B3_ARUDO